jgi:hypothetical protein
MASSFTHAILLPGAAEITDGENPSFVMRTMTVSPTVLSEPLPANMATPTPRAIRIPAMAAG